MPYSAKTGKSHADRNHGSEFRHAGRRNSGSLFVVKAFAIASLAWLHSSEAQAGGTSTTTLYASRHFEVRDHDQPVKYVFLGNSRVARVTGSLRNALRVQRLRLFPGWNLCSLAVATTNTLGQFTNASPSILEPQGIFRWDAGLRSWSPVVPGQDLAAGSVLWLHARTNASLPLIGTYVEPGSRSVQANGDFLPSAGLEAWDLGATLSNNPSTTASTFDSAALRWSFRYAPPLPPASDAPSVVPPGAAVFMQTEAPAQLEVPDSALRIRYFHPDHIGSPGVITDGLGDLVEETAYYPFGAVRHADQRRSVEEEYKFNQKERDAETGLHYFEARHLAGRFPRFISVDPKYANPDSLTQGDLLAFLSGPQAVNLYSYTGNNPVGFIDPLGLDRIDSYMFKKEYAEAAKYREAHPRGRALSQDERKILEDVYGDSIPYDRIRVLPDIGANDRPWMFVSGSWYHLNVGKAAFEGTVEEGTLVHEAGHVWQSKHTGLTRYGYLISSGWRQVAAELFSSIDISKLKQGKLEFSYTYDPYTFDESDVGKKPWSYFNPEQQADIIEGWYKRGKKEDDPAYGYIKHNIRPGEQHSDRDVKLWFKDTYGYDLK